MCNAEGDGLESDGSPMGSDTDVRSPVDDFFEQTETASLARLATARIPRLEAPWENEKHSFKHSKARSYASRLHTPRMRKANDPLRP